VKRVGGPQRSPAQTEGARKRRKEASPVDVNEQKLQKKKTRKRRRRKRSVQNEKESEDKRLAAQTREDWTRSNPEKVPQKKLLGRGKEAGWGDTKEGQKKRKAEKKG